MSYRDFARPPGAEDMGSLSWMQWMHAQGGALVPVVPQHASSCRECFGACGLRDDGDTWDLCWNCRTYDGVVDTFVPITYSIDAGLESMLHRYKDRDVTWLRTPLAALLLHFLAVHADCIDEDARGIEVATLVPSDNQQRNFNHLESLVRGVFVSDPALAHFDWDLDVIERVLGTSRPGRGELKPAAYAVDHRAVDGAAVLLMDDLWTSGSSAASAAAALKTAGAAHVTVLTLGRQLTPSRLFGSTTEIYDDRRRRDWSNEECVLCR